MSSNRLEVINAALIKVGAETIADPDENRENARKAKAIFDRLCRAELRKQAWSFAIKRTSLAIVDTSPVFGYSVMRQLPADFLRLVTWGEDYVFDVDDMAVPDDAPYSIEGDKIVDNESGAVFIRYVADVTGDVPIWDATFVEAFACKLAIELSPTLQRSVTKKQDLKADYKEALREAKRTNAIERPPGSVDAGSWTAVRYGGGGYSSPYRG